MKLKAYIKTPSGKVIMVDNIADYKFTNNLVAISTKDGTTYATHTSNVLLVEEEMSDEHAEKT